MNASRIIIPLVLLLTSCGVKESESVYQADGSQTSARPVPFVEVSAICQNNPVFTANNRLLCQLSEQKQTSQDSLFVHIQAVCMIEDMKPTKECENVTTEKGVYKITPSAIFASSWLGVDHGLSKISGALIAQVTAAPNGTYDPQKEYETKDYCRQASFASQDKLLCAAVDSVSYPITVGNVGTAQTIDADLDLRLFFSLAASSTLTSAEYWRLYSSITDFITSVKETISNQFGVIVETKDFVIIQADINGFADPSGPAFLNQLLSERRALSAARFVGEVAEQIGVDIGAITALGQGEKPNVCPREFRNNFRLMRACLASQRSAEIKLKFQIDIP